MECRGRGCADYEPHGVALLLAQPVLRDSVRSNVVEQIDNSIRAATIIFDCVLIEIVQREQAEVLRACASKCENRLFGVSDDGGRSSFRDQCPDNVCLCGDSVLEFVDEEEWVTRTQASRNHREFVQDSGGEVQDVVVVECALRPIECLVYQQVLVRQNFPRGIPKLWLKPARDCNVQVATALIDS